MTSPLASAGSLAVQHAVISRRAESDNGTVHIYVQNVGPLPVSIGSVEVAAGESRPNLSASQQLSKESELPYIWWRAMPNPIPPQGFADLAVKLARCPTRKVSVGFRGSGNVNIEHEVDRVNDALNIASVGFPADLATVFVYAENQSGQSLSVRRVAINGLDVTGKARILPDVLAPLEKTAIVISPDRPFTSGEHLFVRVDAAEGQATGVALTRAFSHFPITWLDGSLPLGLNEGRHTASAPKIRSGSVPGEGLANIENIMRCPAHAHGTRDQAAATFIARHEKLMQDEPPIPGLMYVCRWEKEINYFVFAELGDLVRIMPFAGSVGYAPSPLEHRMQWLTELGVRAAAPRPLHAVVPIRFGDSFQWERSLMPQEVRALIYLPLSRGARGLCYGQREPGLSPQAEQELAKVTREVASIRDYLVFAERFAMGRTHHPLVEAATLLAGDRGMVVLMINHGFEDFDNARLLQCAPAERVRAEIALPKGLRVAIVRDVELASAPVTWRQDGERLVLECDRVPVVRPYLVLFEPGDSTSVQRQHDGGGDRP